MHALLAELEEHFFKQGVLEEAYYASAGGKEVDLAEAAEKMELTYQKQRLNQFLSDITEDVFTNMGFSLFFNKNEIRYVAERPEIFECLNSKQINYLIEN